MNRFFHGLPDISKKYLKLQLQDRPKSVLGNRKPVIPKSIHVNANPQSHLESIGDGQTRQKLIMKSPDEKDKSNRSNRIPISLSKPMRVPRELVTPSTQSDVPVQPARPPTRALRVPSSQAHIVVNEDVIPNEVSLVSQESCNITTSQTSSVNVSVSKKRPIVYDFVTSPRTEKPLDLQAITSQFHSSDWAMRKTALENLNNLILHSNKELKSTKIIELLSQGLDDAHFRIQEVALTCVASLLDQGIIWDSLYLKTIGTVTLSKFKSNDKYDVLLNRFSESLNEHALLLLMQSLTDTQILQRKPKLKYGLLYCFSVIPMDTFSHFLDKNTHFWRSCLSKWTLFCSMDLSLESNVHCDRLKTLLTTLHSISDSSFWNAWDSLSLTEQGSYTKVFGNAKTWFNTFLLQSDDQMQVLENESNESVEFFSPKVQKNQENQENDKENNQQEFITHIINDILSSTIQMDQNLNTFCKNYVDETLQDLILEEKSIMLKSLSSDTLVEEDQEKVKTEKKVELKIDGILNEISHSMDGSRVYSCLLLLNELIKTQVESLHVECVEILSRLIHCRFLSFNDYVFYIS